MKLLLVVFLVICVSCNNGASVPDDVLPPDKMQSVLFDIFQADELVSYKASMDTSFNNIRSSVRLYKGIFQLHKISEDQFRKSFSYYESHPRLFRTIMDTLEKRSARVHMNPM